MAKLSSAETNEAKSKQSEPVKTDDTTSDNNSNNESSTTTNSNSNNNNISKSNKSDSNANGNAESSTNKNDKLDEITSSKSAILKYEINEKVWAHNRDMLYLAKILRKEEHSGVPHYYVHYDGWAKSHDEWLAHDSLLKNTEDAQILASKMKVEIARLSAEQKNKRKSSSGKDGNPSKKPKIEINDLTVDADMASDSIGGDKGNRITIPANLKKQLILDWEAITRKQMLVPLPRSPSIEELFDSYLITYAANEAKQHLQTEVCNGLKHYFNRALPTILLYRFERPQWKAMIEKYPNLKLTQIYGSEHLLRLFVKLPSLLQHTQMSDCEMKLLKQQIDQFLSWMSTQASSTVAYSSGNSNNSNNNSNSNSNASTPPKKEIKNDFFTKTLLPTDSKYVQLIEQ